MKKKNLLIILCILLLSIALGIIGASYAFFSDPVTYGNEETVTSGVMSLNLADGTKITANNLVPGEHIDKTFEVQNTGTVTAQYDIYLSEVINTFETKSDLVYELISEDGGYQTSEPIQVPSEPTKIISEQAINGQTTHHYILRITFLNTNQIQNNNMNKVFEAKIQINEYHDINTNINFYLDNNLVENMPDNTHGYMSESSSCNNNATISFDSTNWTYHLNNINQNNTTCNLYFESLTSVITLENAKFSDNSTEKELQIGDSVTILAIVPSDYTESSWSGNTSCSTSSDVGNTYYYVHHAYSVESWNVNNSTDSTITYTVPANDQTVTATIKDTTSELNKYECYSTSASYQSSWYTCNSGDSRSGSTCTHTSTYTASEDTSSPKCPSGFQYNSTHSDCRWSRTTGVDGENWTKLQCEAANPSYKGYSPYQCSGCSGTGSANKEPFTKICSYKTSVSYDKVCNSGDSLSGSTCTHTETYNATYHSGYYYCNYGTRDGQICLRTRSVS